MALVTRPAAPARASRANRLLGTACAAALLATLPSGASAQEGTGVAVQRTTTVVPWPRGIIYKDGKLVTDATTPGRAGSHGQRWPFEVVVRDAAHPIVKGLPNRWMHDNDELYDRLRGPARNMTHTVARRMISGMTSAAAWLIWSIAPFNSQLLKTLPGGSRPNGHLTVFCRRRNLRRLSVSSHRRRPLRSRPA